MDGATNGKVIRFYQNRPGTIIGYSNYLPCTYLPHTQHAYQVLRDTLGPFTVPGEVSN